MNLPQFMEVLSASKQNYIDALNNLEMRLKLESSMIKLSLKMIGLKIFKEKLG